MDEQKPRRRRTPQEKIEVLPEEKTEDIFEKERLDAHHSMPRLPKKLRKRKNSPVLIAITIIEGLIVAILALSISFFALNGWTNNGVSGFVSGIITTPTPIPTPTYTPVPTATPTPVVEYIYITPEPAPMPTSVPTVISTSVTESIYTTPKPSEEMQNIEIFDILGVQFGDNISTIEYQMIDNKNGMFSYVGDKSIYEAFIDCDNVCWFTPTSTFKIYGVNINSILFKLSKENSTVESIEIRYKENQKDFASVKNRLIYLYGDNSIDESRKAHQTDAYCWKYTNTEIHLSPSLAFSTLSDAENGIEGFSVELFPILSEYQSQDNKKENTKNSEYNLSIGEIRNGIKFGMSKLEVKEIETAEYIEEDANNILYNTYILSNQYNLLYRFSNERLVEIDILLDEHYTSSNRYIIEYKSLCKELCDKYGYQETMYAWFDDFYKGDESNYGIAVLKGDLTLLTDWEFDDAVISFCLSGNNYEANQVIIYDSKEYISSIDSSSQAL